MKKPLILTIGLLILFTSILVNCAAAAPIYNYENGHYYDAISPQDGIVWNDAKSAANQLTLDMNGVQMKGHLATINSWDENEFIKTNFPVNGHWIGGFQQAGSQEPFTGWQWVTGEPWDYTNWNQDVSYDLDDEYALQFWGPSGQWYLLSSNSLNFGYIVEYEEIPLEQPSILDQSVTPNIVSPEDETTFTFKINNPNTENVDVRLVAQIRANDSQGEWINDPANDQIVTLVPGINECSRTFRIPGYVSTGSYDARWVIYDPNVDPGIDDPIDSKTMPLKLDIKIHIIDQSLSTSPVSPGGTITFNFDISNPNMGDIENIRLVAKIRNSDIPNATWSDDPNYEIITLSPGRNQYSRTFTVQRDVSLGYYDALWMIVDETTGEIIDSKIVTHILEVSGPSITDQYISPIFIESGNERLTFNYTIYNPGTENIDIKLGARIRTSNPVGEMIDDPANDQIVTLYPGINYCSRAFIVPQSAVPGFYDAEWSIVDTTTGYPLYTKFMGRILKIGKSSLSGGPDYFGYTFKDSNVEGGPTYNWIDITSTGTQILPNNESGYIDDIPIGFSFNFYGANYSRIGTTNNGIIAVGSGGIGWGNQPIGASDPHNLILPIWNYPAAWDNADAIYYETIGEAPNRKFIVLWNIQHYDNSPKGITFEAILFEGSNNILFQYKDVDFGIGELNLGGSATVGIEGPDGKGLQYSYGKPVIEPEKAILFKFPQYAGPNLYLSKQAPDSKDHGSSMTYTLYYNNFGNASAQNVVLEDRLPDKVEFESASDGGVYDPSTRKVTWDLGSVDSGGRGYRTLTVSIPGDIPVGTVITNNANISTLNLEDRYEDNEAQAETRVTELNLPPNVGVEPNNGGIGRPSVNWGNPVTFSYYSCPSATAIDIKIHIDDGGQDIVGNMAGGPPDWTYTTTFYPRHGSATVTYTVHGCDGVQDVSFNIYIDPAGYIYDIDTGQRIADASVWLQRPDGEGGWENVPTGESIPVAQPDVNPQVTGEDGMYQWDVLEGSYRVHVEAPGYEPANSIVVSVPPPVFDLHVGLISTNVPPTNVPPIADAGGPYEGTAGVAVRLNGSRSYDTDANWGDSIVSYDWDLDGDGLYDDATGATVDHTWDHAYSGQVGLQVTDTHGETNNSSATINIVERDLLPPSSITDLQSTNGTTWLNWTWTNPTDLDFNHTEIYLNGTFQTNTSAEYFNATDLQPETDYTISTQTVDAYGNVNETWVNLTTITKKEPTKPVANAGPDQVVEQTNPGGTTVTLDGSGSTDNGQTPLTYTWTWNGGSASGVSPSIILLEGTTTVTLMVFNGEFSSTDTVNITVKPLNKSPVAESNGPYAGNEGSLITLNATGSSDPDSGSLIYEWDFDKDGVFDVSSSKPFATHSWADDYTGTIVLRVTDEKGLNGTATADLTVNNVPSNIGEINSPVDPIKVGDPVTVKSTFIDAGVLDTHTASWDWDGSLISDGSITENGGAGTVIGIHKYSSAGVYKVNLTVTDDDLGSNYSVSNYIVVYDPNGGFVTGGGWINSTKGAYLSDPSLTGTANFGFVSKYQKGSNVPTGITEFNFQVANLNFHSGSYEWLVISGARAQYKGTGTINGKGEYGFMLTAIDGELNGGGGTDKLRIKIWDKTSGDIVYDNMIGAVDTADPTTLVQKGSITIHKEK